MSPARRFLSKRRDSVLGTLLLVTWMLPSPARAVCVTPSTDSQSPSADPECLDDSIELFWPTRCIPFGVSAEGSPRHGISFEEAHQAFVAAFETWSSAECDDGTPALELVDRGPMQCERVEFLPEAEWSNNNIVIFRDDEWPYDGNAAALTTLTFLARNGEILDADIEVNTASNDFSIDGDEGVDLQTLFTHELGHALAFEHSTEPGSVMAPNIAQGERRRTLADSDRSNVCEVYSGKEPQCGKEVLDRDFTRQCAEPPEVDVDCAARIARRNDAGSWPWALLLGLAPLLRHRALRRRRA